MNSINNKNIDFYIEDNKGNFFYIDDNYKIQKKSKTNSDNLFNQSYTKVTVPEGCSVSTLTISTESIFPIPVKNAKNIYYKELSLIIRRKDMIEFMTNEKSVFINHMSEIEKKDILESIPSHFINIDKYKVVNMNKVVNFNSSGIEKNKNFFISFNFKDTNGISQHFVNMETLLKFKNYHKNKRKQQFVDYCKQI